MVKKNSRIISSIALSLMLLIGLFGGINITAFAATDRVTEDYDDDPVGGLKQSVVIEDEISEKEYNEVLSKDEMNESENFSYSEKGTSGYWSSFSQPFYSYNDKLTANQKQLYDDLYATLYAMIDGGDDVALFSHYLTSGIYEGRQASSNFNLWTYISNYEDLRNAFGWDLGAYVLHYINYGRFEGRVAV